MKKRGVKRRNAGKKRNKGARQGKVKTGRSEGKKRNKRLAIENKK